MNKNSVFSHYNFEEECMEAVFKVLMFSTVAFLFLFIITKIEGKKKIAQMSFNDYVIAISLGSIAAEFATLTDEPWYHYIIAMSVFFLLDLVITLVERKGFALKKFFRGKPLVLIEQNTLNYENLKKSKLTVEDILALLRSKGYFNIADVSYAVLETTGDLSVMPVDSARPATSQDVNAQPQPTAMPLTLVVDGAINQDGLNKLNKDEKWLLNKLHKAPDSGVKDILLASYDNATDEITLFTKPIAKN